MENGRFYFAASATLVFACYVLTRLRRCPPTNETANCPKLLAENDTNTAAVSSLSSCGVSDMKSDIADGTPYEISKEIEEAKKSVKDKVLRMSKNLQQTSPQSVDDVLPIIIEDVNLDEEKQGLFSQNNKNTTNSPCKEQTSETLAEFPLSNQTSSSKNENTVDRFCDAHRLTIESESNRPRSLPRDRKTISLPAFPVLAKAQTSPFPRKKWNIERGQTIGVIPELKPYKSQELLDPKYIRRRKPSHAVRLRRLYRERSFEEDREASLDTDWRAYTPELSSTEEPIDNKSHSFIF